MPNRFDVLWSAYAFNGAARCPAAQPAANPVVRAAVSLAHCVQRAKLAIFNGGDRAPVVVS